MQRNFDARPVPSGVVDALLDQARRAPSAGNAQGGAFVVLEGADQTVRYWDVTLPAERRAGFRWPGLLAALGVPSGGRAVGTVALGHALPDEPGRSARRPRPPLDQVVHRGGW